MIDNGEYRYKHKAGRQVALIFVLLTTHLAKIVSIFSFVDIFNVDISNLFISTEGISVKEEMLSLLLSMPFMMFVIMTLGLSRKSLSLIDQVIFIHLTRREILPQDARKLERLFIKTVSHRSLISSNDEQKISSSIENHLRPAQDFQIEQVRKFFSN